MRIVLLRLAILAISFASCGKKQEMEEKQMVENHIDTDNYEFFGDKMNEGISFLTKEEMDEKFNNLQPGDTINVAFTTTIQEVCQKKGCWMKVDLGEDKNSFVRFKDYGFFAPMNAAGHEVIMSGKAFISVVSIDELKHYAKDAGKTEEEIAQINEPKVTYSFEADAIGIAK